MSVVEMRQPDKTTRNAKVAVGEVVKCQEQTTTVCDAELANRARDALTKESFQ
jgi:hypothetical protein